MGAAAGCGPEGTAGATVHSPAAAQMLQCRGAPIVPLPPSAQRRAKAEADEDDAHTPNDEYSSRAAASRSLAEALSALMSMAPDATDARGHQMHIPAAADTVKTGPHTGERTAGTPANSSDEDVVRHSSSSDEDSRDTPENPAVHDRGADAAIPQPGASDRVDAAAARSPADDEFYRENIEYLRKLPNGANLAAALMRRAHGMQPELATLPDPKTRTFYVAPHAPDESERRARLVALVKYKRKREQQQLHPQVRYTSRKKIADNRVSYSQAFWW